MTTPDAPLDDDRLLSRYASTRDVEAFTALVERHGGMVYGTCLRQCSDRSLAEDAAQECFLALAAHAGEIRQSVSAWLHTVAMHAAQRLRRTRREQPLSQLPDPCAPDEVIEAWRLLLPRLDQTLDELPEEVRTLLTWRYLDGRSQQAIAQALQVSQSTVSRRLEQGITLLRTRLARHLDAAWDEDRLRSALAVMAVPAPASLLSYGAKIGLAGIHASASHTTSVGLLGMTTGVAIGVLSVSLAVIMASGWHHRLGHDSARTPVPSPSSTPLVGAPAQVAISAPIITPIIAPGVLLTLPITASVHRWPLDRVVELIQDQLPLQDGVGCELMPCAQGYPLVECACVQRPLGAVLDDLVQQCGWRYRVRDGHAYLDHALGDAEAMVTALLQNPAPTQEAAMTALVSRGDLEVCAALLARLGDPGMDALAQRDPAAMEALQLAALHALARVGGSWQSWFPAPNPLGALAHDGAAQQGVVSCWRRCRAGSWPITPFLCYLAGELRVTAVSDQLLALAQQPETLVPGAGASMALVRARTRQWAIFALGRVGLPADLPYLHAVITAAPADPAQLAGLSALGELADASAVPLLMAMPPPQSWLQGVGTYVCRYRLAPAAMQDLLALPNPAMNGVADAFISYPVPQALPALLPVMSAPMWWVRLAAWKGSGRLPAAEVDAMVRSAMQHAGSAAERVPYQALLARHGDREALDAVILAVLTHAETGLSDPTALDVEDVATAMAAQLSPALGVHLVDAVMAQLDLAHVTDGTLSLLAARRPPALPGLLMGWWPQASPSARGAIIRYLAAERSPPARDFLLARLAQGPDAEQTALALRWRDLADPELRQRLLMSLVDPQAMVSVDLATHGLAAYRDSAPAVAAFLRRVAVDQRIDGHRIAQLDDHVGIVPDPDADTPLVDVMLQWLRDSTHGDTRQQAVTWLRTHCRNDLRPCRHRLIAQMDSLLPRETDAGVASLEQACLSDFLGERGELDGDAALYHEPAIMEGALDPSPQRADLEHDRVLCQQVLAMPPPAVAAPHTAAPGF